MKNTVAVFASARANGNTRKLIDWICTDSTYNESSNIDLIDLTSKNISAYDYDHNNLDDDFLPVIKQLLQYDNIIFATPIYWYAASAQMKVFIDRTTDFLALEELKDIGRQLRNKNCYLVCSSASEQADANFLNTLQNTFTYLGMNYKGHIHASCSDGFVASKYQDDVAEFIKLIRA